LLPPWSRKADEIAFGRERWMSNIYRWDSVLNIHCLSGAGRPKR